MRRAAYKSSFALLLALAASACGDGDSKVAGKGDAEVTDPNVDKQDAAPAEDAGVTVDASDTADAASLQHCLDRPGELQRPPQGKLPCELIPPGLTL